MEHVILICHMLCMNLHRISQNHKGSSEDADLTWKRNEDILTKPIRPFFEKKFSNYNNQNGGYI